MDKSSGRGVAAVAVVVVLSGTQLGLGDVEKGGVGTLSKLSKARRGSEEETARVHNIVLARRRS
jgi:hypothetical protein